jgi:hypothetical protein
MSRSWAHRIKPPGPHEIEELRDAAEDLERQAKRAPHGTGPIFSNVTSILFLGTALISTVLAGMHLYDKLSRERPLPRGRPAPDNEPEHEHRRAHQHSSNGAVRRSRG